MIVSLLGILFSMYLLYVVPIQGRDAEISHMKYITQEFIGLKADIDGLIINDKINLPIARSFELGTLSSVGSGALSIMPMSSYIEASGTLMVNEQNDFLKVTVNGNFADIGKRLQPLINEIKCDNYENCPQNPIEFNIADRYYEITTKKRESLKNVPITINLTDIYSTYPNGTKILNEPFKQIDAIANINSTTPIVSYDLVLLISDNSTGTPKVIGERKIVDNFTTGYTYTYNVLNDNDLIPSSTSTYYLTHSSQYIPPDNFTTRTINTKVRRYPPRVGSFQYESKNRYWINQNLLYEMGGLFLSQPSDGGSSIMLVPSIALSPVQRIDDIDRYYLKVSINNIRITDTEDVSGSVSAQIFTKVDQINHNLFMGTESWSEFGDPPDSDTVKMYKIQDANIPNAHSVWLQFIPDDPRVVDEDEGLDGTKIMDVDRMILSTQLWKRGFDQIKTISDKTFANNPGGERFSNWIYTFRIEDRTNKHYSANMVIGEKARAELSDKCPPKTTNSECLVEIDNYMHTSADNESFIFDYTESEISLVMQSGAL